MSHPLSHNCNKGRDIRQEDLLDLLENLEKRRRNGEIERGKLPSLGKFPGGGSLCPCIRENR